MRDLGYEQDLQRELDRKNAALDTLAATNRDLLRKLEQMEATANVRAIEIDRLHQVRRDLLVELERLRRDSEPRS